MERNIFISLGYNCFVKKFIDHKIRRKETLLFDNIGSSVQSILEIFESRFCEDNMDKLFDKNDYKYAEILENMNLVTNMKYYLRFQHDLDEKSLSNEDKYKEFVEKYKRRLIRMRKLFDDTNNEAKSNKTIIMIRLEEDPDVERIKYDNVVYGDEYKYLNELINIIKNKWENIDIKIIFLYRGNREYEQKNNIYPVKLESKITYHTSENVIHDTLRNIEIIKKLINE
jgi:hypothetical protein